MKKLATVSLALLCTGLLVSSSAFAGGVTNVGLGVDVALPMGDFGDLAGTGIGGTFSGQYDVNANISLTGRTGYIAFSGDDFEIFGAKSSYSFSLIPIHGGARYFVTPPNGDAARFFVGGELGIDIFKTKVEVDVPGVGKTSGDDSSSDLAFAPMGGVQFGAFEIMGILSISDADYFGARVSYLIPVGANQ